MANPTLVSCPQNEWTLVATAVNIGSVYPKSSMPGLYLFTYRMTGDDAPTTDDEGVHFDDFCTPIESTQPIDVYVMALNHDGVVRVDL